MVTRAEGKTHTLTLRDVKISEDGEVKLTAKDFQIEARLHVNGRLRFVVFSCGCYRDYCPNCSLNQHGDLFFCEFDKVKQQYSPNIYSIKHTGQINMVHYMVLYRPGS